VAVASLTHAAEPGSPTGVPVRLSLLGGFGVWTTARAPELANPAQRLVAFLALHDRPVGRLTLAGTLWPEASEERAAACLRSALWRLRRLGPELVESRGSELRLARGVDVDVTRLVAAARRIEAHEAVEDMGGLADRFGQDLLPHWYDEWVSIWRERWRHLRLQALESLASALAAGGVYSRAVEAALAAVEAEPLRESAHRALIQVHLHQGNQAEALRQYHAYRRLLHIELGMDPSPLMETLMFAPWRPGTAQHAGDDVHEPVRRPW
jgi:DNA-binding SARP family transcriptional activator